MSWARELLLAEANFVLYRFIGVADIAAVRFSLPAQLLEPTPNLGSLQWIMVARPMLIQYQSTGIILIDRKPSRGTSPSKNLSRPG
jgi:hypothetical protein